jgi:hypothetical protein
MQKPVRQQMANSKEWMGSVQMQNSASKNALQKSGCCVSVTIQKKT